MDFEEEKDVKIEEEEMPELIDVDSDEEEEEAPLGSIFEPHWTKWYKNVLFGRIPWRPVKMV